MQETAMRWATGEAPAMMTPLQQAQQQQQQHPMVSMPMLQCVLCANPFSMSGKLSDLRTPVLAVNPSASIEGPYCIACAGKREGLRSFHIDDARVTLVKLMHQHMAQAQLSTGAVYAYAALHQHQQHQHPPAGVHGNNKSNNSNPHLPQQQQQQQLPSKRDAPGLTSDVGGSSKDNNTNSILAAMSHKRHKTASSSSNNPYVKSTWTEQEDSFLLHAVTQSQEQPFTRWSDLSTQLPGRVGKQIRDRWLNHLDPKIDRSPFSRDEDVKLYKAFKKHGKRWVEISNTFFDAKRSENHIKNRWYSASFKKFVKTELGEDPFLNNNNNNNHAPNGKAVAAAAALASSQEQLPTKEGSMKKGHVEPQPAENKAEQVASDDLEGEEKKNDA